MRAGQIAEPAPVVRLDGPALDAVRLVADTSTHGVVVVDETGRPVTLLTESRLIGLFLARQHGHPISFGQFARYGVPVALGSVALCVPYLLLRYA